MRPVTSSRANQSCTSSNAPVLVDKDANAPGTPDNGQAAKRDSLRVLDIESRTLLPTNGEPASPLLGQLRLSRLLALGEGDCSLGSKFVMVVSALGGRANAML